jgi:hypothetical protein
MMDGYVFPNRTPSQQLEDTGADPGVAMPEVTFEGLFTNEDDDPRVSQ